MMHDGAKQLSTIDSIITTAISPPPDGPQGLDIKDREYISTLFLEVRVYSQSFYYFPFLSDFMDVFGFLFFSFYV